MISRCTLKQKKFFELLIWMIWTQSILMQYIRAVLLRIPVVRLWPDTVIGVLYILIIVLSLREFKAKANIILIVLIIIALFLVERLTRNVNNLYLDAYFPSFLLHTLPMLIVGAALAENPCERSIIYNLYRLSSVTIIINFIYDGIFGTPMDKIVSLYQGNMNLAYNLLPHCCLVTFYARKKPTVFNVGLTLLSIFYLLMLGTRGAVLFLLINIGWNFLSGKRLTKVIARIVILFLSLVLVLKSPLYTIMIRWMYSVAQNFGLSVRIFDKLMQGIQFGSSGRNELAEQLLQSVRNNYLFGTGLCSDRLITGGAYSHNILLEFLVEFGVIIGSILLVIMMYIFIQGYCKSYDDESKGFIRTIFCASFLKLFLSSSYLNESFLFFLVGFCLERIKSNKRFQRRTLSYPRLQKL